LQNICYRVSPPEGEQDILKNVSITIPDHKLVVFTGPNGGGKTTLAKVIMGLVQPTSGRVLYNGEDVTDLSITERAKRGISYGFQQPPRFKGITVHDLLLLAALVAEQPPPTAAAAPVLLAVLSVAGIRMTTARGDSDTSTFTMPVYIAGLSQEVADLQTALTESQARLTSDDPWAHVCAYALGGGSHFGMLYAVPDGMGLQFDEDTYLLDPANKIHSRYVMANTDSDVFCSTYRIIYGSNHNTSPVFHDATI